MGASKRIKTSLNYATKELIPENVGSGKHRKEIQRRTLILWISFAIAGMALSNQNYYPLSAKSRAAALSLLFPGAGYIASANIIGTILLLVTYLLLPVALLAWFGAGGILFPCLLWILSIPGAYFATGEEIFKNSHYIALGLLAAFMAYFNRLSRLARKEASTKRITRNSFIESELADIDKISISAPKDAERELDLFPLRAGFASHCDRRFASDIQEAEVGEPTCAVANAGICRGKGVFEATKRDIELTFGVNNLGLLWTAKTFFPSMAKKNHGHFLIIASQTGYLATAGVVDYAATKSAAIAIYEGLQTEMKHFYKAPAVRISCICPSAVDTKMFAGIKGPSNFVMPRLTPEGVANTISSVIWSGNAQNLMIPAFAYISAPTRCLPEWMRVGMQDGGAEVMTELKPHDPFEKK